MINSQLTVVLVSFPRTPRVISCCPVAPLTRRAGLLHVPRQALGEDGDPGDHDEHRDRGSQQPA